MNLFKREMKSGMKALILWSVGMVFLIAAGMGKYGGLTADMGSVEALLALYPKPIRAFFGVGMYDLGDAMGFYGVLYTFVMLIGGIYAAMLGANILAKEERDKTAEFLLVKPRTRGYLLGVKAAAAVAQMAILTFVTWAASFGMVGMYKPAAAFAAPLCQLTIGLFALMLVFFAAGQAIAAIARRAEKAAALSSAVLMIAFVATMIASINSALAALDWISPFGLFHARRTLLEGGIPLGAWAIAIVLVAGCMGIALAVYPKRDIAA